MAVDIHTDLMKLASGLMAAGAQPEAVQTLQRMAQIVGQLVKVLGAGPVGGQGAQAAGTPQAQATAPAGPPAQAQVTAPAGPAPTGANPGERPNVLDAATEHLRAAIAASKAK